MKHPVKKILGAVFVGYMLMSTSAMKADAADAAPKIDLFNVPVMIPSIIQHKGLESASEMLTQPYSVLGDWNLDIGERGTDETPKFTMEKGKGLYLRWYCAVPEYSEPVHVYLYDIGKGEIVSAMSPRMEPGEKRTEVFYVGSDSSLCQFRIKIESETGGTAFAKVRANQISGSRAFEEIKNVFVV